VPEHPDIIASWERDAAAYRASRAEKSELGLRTGTHPRQFVDLFLPDTLDPKRPLVVFIHGGYWRSFAPSQFSHFARGMNARGYAVALPSYRLCPEVTIADIVDDARAALLFLHQRFAAPFVVAGHSAGGHLAAAAIATDWPALGAPKNLARRVFTMSGLFDLVPFLQTSINDDLHLDADAAKAMSPAFWPAPKDAVLEAWVGGDESSEYLRQSALVAERWSAAGARAHAKVVPGANHFTVPNPLAEPESKMVAALAKLADAAEKA